MAGKRAASARGAVIVRVVASALILSVPIAARAYGPDPPISRTPPRNAASAAAPYYENRRHHIGRIQLSIDNVGGYGDPYDGCTRRNANGIEFPAGSDVTFFYGGGIWIGAVRGRDTLVSVGFDSWHPSLREMYPAPYPEGAIKERTTRTVLKPEPASFCRDVLQSDDAISEQDLIAVYTDTLFDPSFASIDPLDGRPHVPLGLEIMQTSYGWSFGYAQDFVIIEYAIKNITRAMKTVPRGGETLERIYIALYGHEGVHHSSNSDGWDDDITGMLHTVPMPGHPELRDTVYAMWMADNDGDPEGGKYGPGSSTSVAGIRVLRTPRDNPHVTFNWWAPNYNSTRDWGPVRKGSKVQFTHSGLGTPAGDRVRYQLMSNGEFDYPQVEAAVNHESEGWLPPYPDAAFAANLADGFHTHFLFSSGPFNLEPDSILRFAVAVIGGENFHRDPANFQAFFDPYDPQPYLDRLDFTDFGRNAQWAAWVYDSPGVDTDGDGDRGAYFVSGEDTVYYRGDGVPDFKGPPPPPAPVARLTTVEGRVTIRWNGRRSETEIDPFSLSADFEGYRVYMSRTGRFEDYALLASRDVIDYERHTWDPLTRRWEVREAPFRFDSLQSLYDSLVRADYGFAFHPDSFQTAALERALLVTILDPRDPSQLDSAYYYFRPFDANPDVNDLAYARQIASGSEVTGVIRKVYPEAQVGDTLLDNRGHPFAPYYEYEYAIDGLQVAEPIFVAVTAYDHGDPSLGLEPLESSPVGNAYEVWPINSVEVVNTERPQPGVYPNPYRISDDYNAAGWENARGLEPDPERARKVTFFNLPDTCVVTIYSLDGDLIRRLEHREDPSASNASVVVWNLISRNTQAIKTGIYIWAVESRFGTHVGKLVVIK